MKPKYEGAINYTGNKSKLIPKLNALFDKSNCTRLVDCCAGGLSVSLHSNFHYVQSNDIDPRIIGLYNWMAEFTFEEIDLLIKSVIESYGLTKTDKDAYMRLRNALNDSLSNNDDNWPLLLLVTHYYAFSNMIRFSKNGFNTAFGEREYNDGSRAKLEKFFDILKEKFIIFTNHDYKDIVIGPQDLVYIDPPYLITDAAYNKWWSEEEDAKMMSWLDMLNENGVKFVMSNVTHHRGKVNQKLLDWSSKYNVHCSDHKYISNAYRANDMDQKTVEVMICNF